jgi:hypothetical protein
MGSRGEDTTLLPAASRYRTIAIYEYSPKGKPRAEAGLEVLGVVKITTLATCQLGAAVLWRTQATCQRLVFGVTESYCHSHYVKERS